MLFQHCISFKKEPTSKGNKENVKKPVKNTETPLTLYMNTSALQSYSRMRNGCKLICESDQVPKELFPTGDVKGKFIICSRFIQRSLHQQQTEISIETEAPQNRDTERKENHTESPPKSAFLSQSQDFSLNNKMNII